MEGEGYIIHAERQFAERQKSAETAPLLAKQAIITQGLWDLEALADPPSLPQDDLRIYAETVFSILQSEEREDLSEQLFDKGCQFIALTGASEKAIQAFAWNFVRKHAPHIYRRHNGSSRAILEP